MSSHIIILFEITFDLNPLRSLPLTYKVWYDVLIPFPDIDNVWGFHKICSC